MSLTRREKSVSALYTQLYSLRYFILVLPLLLWGIALCIDINFPLISSGIVGKGSDPARCLDSDDPLEWKPKKCPCSDPRQATPSDRVWREYHERLVSAAKAAKNPDVVLVGDSITERWNGTRHLGTRGPFPGTRAVFDEFFPHGLALGASGDTTNHLLWHMQHGLFTENLNPSVWVLLIGTNNMGRTSCSKRNTLTGIVEALRVLLVVRPGTPVILHGLLPRNDKWQGPEAHDFSLGHWWSNILWINRELKVVCEQEEHCFYMGTPDIFLRTNATTGETYIDKDLMTDALHPSDQGYRAWAPLIVQKIQEVARISREKTGDPF